MRMLVTSKLWQRTWMGLRARGEGQREAACIWAGYRTAVVETVEEVCFLDDYKGTLSEGRYHCTPRRATTALFLHLRERGLVILADIHMHPSSWVGLSEVDQEHPIEYHVGLLALVLPFYARKAPDIRQVGVHEYRGNGSWHEFDRNEVGRRLEIEGARR